MKQGLERLRDNKLATAACIGLVLALTGLGVWTNSTAERQGEVEREVRVQHTEVVQALCDHAFTDGCLRRAVNIVKTCQADVRCSALLAAGPNSGPDISGDQDRGEFRVENRHTYGTDNSSQEKSVTPGINGPRSPPKSGSGGKPKSPPKSGSGTQETSESSKPGGEGGAPAATGGSAEEGPLGSEESDGGAEPGGSSGLLPSTIESVEGTVECVVKLDPGCIVGEVVGPIAPGR
jgi:hypothetical protein